MIATPTTTVSSSSIEAAQKWATLDPNPITAEYTRNLIDDVMTTTSDGSSPSPAMESIESLFPSDGQQRIGFGTAGLRSEMKPGPLGMNDLTVCQTAQGLAKYCVKKHSQQPSKKLCAVVGYDHRSHPTLNISSLSFAILTAIIFAEAGIDCILLDGFVMTPLVPFAIQKLGAICGVMVTASHNPKTDNGYKVYDGDACQIRSPTDKAIASEILNNLEPWKDYRSKVEDRRTKHTNDPCLGLSDPKATQELLADYFSALRDSGLYTGQAPRLLPSGKAPSFAYTAMHGIGHPFAKRVFETFGMEAFRAVPEQRDPDPSFPTVKFPNPEENGSLDIAKAFADAEGCEIILANDPDADRLAVAEKDRSTGNWTIFSGDQIGTMLGLWIWESIGKHSDKPVSMCTSTVSSKMLAEIGRKEGFRVEECMTGFKWIGSRSAALQSEGYQNLFAYEEAIGFASGNVIFDKDGISAMAVLAELALNLYCEQGRSLKDHMDHLYSKYGFFCSQNGYYSMSKPLAAKAILDRLRSGGTYQMLKELVGPDRSVVNIRDLGYPGFDSSKPDHKPTLPVSKSAPLLTIKLSSGCVIQLRPSGTEPKFKYYLEMQGTPGMQREKVRGELEFVECVLLERLLQPSLNGLTKSR